MLRNTQDGVYDITKFIENHPGGKAKTQSILGAARGSQFYFPSQTHCSPFCFKYNINNNLIIYIYIIWIYIFDLVFIYPSNLLFWNIVCLRFNIWFSLGHGAASGFPTSFSTTKVARTRSCSQLAKPSIPFGLEAQFWQNKRDGPKMLVSLSLAVIVDFFHFPLTSLLSPYFWHTLLPKRSFSRRIYQQHTGRGNAVELLESMRIGDLSVSASAFLQAMKSIWVFGLPPSSLWGSACACWRERVGHVGSAAWWQSYCVIQQWLSLGGLARVLMTKIRLVIQPSPKWPADLVWPNSPNQTLQFDMFPPFLTAMFVFGILFFSHLLPADLSWGSNLPQQQALQRRTAGRVDAGQLAHTEPSVVREAQSRCWWLAIFEAF